LSLPADDLHVPAGHTAGLDARLRLIVLTQIASKRDEESARLSKSDEQRGQSHAFPRFRDLGDAVGTPSRVDESVVLTDLIEKRRIRNSISSPGGVPYADTHRYGRRFKP
jgi:hypothetical protein